jgi:FlaA1/EpsC-like NDP-sugar epimerase
MIPMLSRLADPALSLPRPLKRGLVLGVDAGLCVLSVWLAFYLRLGVFVPLAGAMVWPVSASFVLALPIFITSGLYRAIFRYSGLPAMVALVRASVFYGLAFSAIFTFWGVEGVPRTIGLIQPVLLLMLVGASRAAARVWLGGLYHQQLRKGALPQVLIYGAGNAGRQLASGMANSNEMRVVGFLDDDDRLHGHVLNGLPIYSPENFAELLVDVAVSHVLLALPSVSRQRRNEILKALSAHKVAVRTLPGLSDIATGKVSMSDVHDLEIDDLLGREPVKPNRLLLNLNTHNKTVLVTGAGGSIGSELCRQILTSKPSQLLLLEMSEFALYQIHQELQAYLATEEITKLELVPLLASVCDEGRMNDVMSTWKPHTVYHAAAYKHVPLVEHNVAEGVRNNVWGTRVCAEAAMHSGVSNFVLISTDKAVRPTNIMGSTKRLAEMVLQALAEQNQSVASQGTKTMSARTVFSMVRFGNVLGSSGSVVPLFREQIKNGGPITLTHTDITRYFMTIPEAAQLVIQAGAMGTGGDVFVLDMGQPVRIYDLASRIVKLSGLTLKSQSEPYGDIEITVTGLRPGEKLYEELLIGDNPKSTQHARIMKAHEDFLPWDELQSKLARLNAALAVNDVPQVRALLKDLVPGYQPDGEVVDWVWVENQNKF